MFADDLMDLADRVRTACESCPDGAFRIATAESCTGGLIIGCLTSVSGSSVSVDRGFVTYSNDAKTEMLGVPAEIIAEHGAVSEPVAALMVMGVLARTSATIALSATGIAGPTGGSPDKPVGLVYIGVGRRGGAPRVERHVFPGGRNDVRLATVRRALEMALEAL